MASWASIRKRLGRAYNITPPAWTNPSWEPGQIQASLDTMRQFAEADVQAAINWYWAKKPWKAWASQVLKFLTLLATALGGLIPIVTATGILDGGRQNQDLILWNLHINQVGYLCFGLAAAFLGLDKYFGYSTGWMRYITTAMSLETLLRNFRLDWAKTTSGLAGQPPSGAALENLIQKIQEFCVAARTLVEKETQAWVMEFQTNLSQLEKDAKAALDNARTQAETAQKESRVATDSTRPGAIDLTVENVLETDHGYEVLIDGESRKQAVTSKSCALMGIPPGLHDLTVTAILGGVLAQASQIVTVAAGAAVKVNITLSKTKAAP
jgi:hypothetical protein